MPFEEGNTNGQGRPKGSLNKITAEVREMIYGTLSDLAPNLRTWIEEIKKPEEKIKAYAKLLSFAVPKMTEVYLTNEQGKEEANPEFDWGKLTDQELEELEGYEKRRVELITKCLVKGKIS